MLGTAGSRWLDIEGLPEGLVLQDVAVQDDGFRVNLRGEDTRLVP